MADDHFFRVIEFFAAFAWQALGKMPAPGADAAGINLAAAREAIDILETLRAKTRGNLTPDESRRLEQTIADLQLNYVDVLGRQTKKPDADQPPPAGNAEPGS